MNSTPAAAQPAYHKEILFDRETRDYSMWLDSELVGFARTYHDAEVKLDQLIHDTLMHGGAPVCDADPTYDDLLATAIVRADDVYGDEPLTESYDDSERYVMAPHAAIDAGLAREQDVIEQQMNERVGEETTPCSICNVSKTTYELTDHPHTDQDICNDCYYSAPVVCIHCGSQHQVAPNGRSFCLVCGRPWEGVVRLCETCVICAAGLPANWGKHLCAHCVCNQMTEAPTLIPHDPVADLMRDTDVEREDADGVLGCLRCNTSLNPAIIAAGRSFCDTCDGVFRSALCPCGALLDLDGTCPYCRVAPDHSAFVAECADRTAQMAAVLQTCFRCNNPVAPHEHAGMWFCDACEQRGLARIAAAVRAHTRQSPTVTIVRRCRRCPQQLFGPCQMMRRVCNLCATKIEHIRTRALTNPPHIRIYRGYRLMIVTTERGLDTYAMSLNGGESMRVLGAQWSKTKAITYLKAFADRRKAHNYGFMQILAAGASAQRAAA